MILKRAFEYIEQMQGRPPPDVDSADSERELAKGYARAAEDLTFLASCVLVRLARNESPGLEIQRLRCLMPPQSNDEAARGYRFALSDAATYVEAFTAEAVAAAYTPVKERKPHTKGMQREGEGSFHGRTL